MAIQTKKGPKAATSGPDTKKSTSTLTHITKEEEKKQERHWWSGCKPTPLVDKTGQRFGRLVYIQALYKQNNSSTQRGMVWFYLAKCDCGHWHITRGNGRAISCGCSRKIKDKYWTRDEDFNGLPVLAKVGKRKKFDRLRDCTRKERYIREICKHFSSCQDERVFEGKKLSKRWTKSNGNCYEPASDGDLKYYAKLNRITT